MLGSNPHCSNAILLQLKYETFIEYVTFIQFHVNISCCWEITRARHAQIKLILSLIFCLSSFRR